MFFVYTLADPRKPEDIRYIGKTGRTLDYRLSCHCSDLKARNYRTNWIKHLKNQGLRPLIYPIAMCKSELDTNACEIFCIKQFRDWGYKLTNGTEGGDGVSGRIVSEETKAKIAAKLKGNKNGANPTMETRAKFSMARKGNKHALGYKHTPEELAKIAATSQQYWASRKLPEKIEKQIVEEYTKGKKTVEIEQKQGLSKYHVLTTLRKYGVTIRGAFKKTK